VANRATELRISSADLPIRGRVEESLATFGRAIFKVEIDPAPESEFKIDMKIRVISDAGLASGSMSPMRVRHVPAWADNDDLVLLMIESGEGALQQNGKTIELHSGDAIISSKDEHSLMQANTDMVVHNVRLKRDRLRGMVPDLGSALERIVIPNSPNLQLLSGYARLLQTSDALASEALPLASIHLHDLAALALGAKDEFAAARGRQAAWLESIRRDIVLNACNPAFSIQALAGKHGVTPRYIQKLLSSAKLSFSDYLREQRLLAAFRMLSRQQTHQQSVTRIALDCGFADVSHFSRAFRERFGKTPTEVRDTARIAAQCSP
jgi:AraC-like DNA-binding protein/quercetin dioxygenase-like cupin family protein